MVYIFDYQIFYGYFSNVNNQTLAMLFETLDFDNDGFLSRSDLNKSAKRLGWSWHEAPLLAVFDLLSISGPIPKSEFFRLYQPNTK